jgi:hypothetical protein
MQRRQALHATGCLIATLLGLSAASAQLGKKVPIVAYLDASERSDWWAVLKQQLKELGYVEGRNVTQ